MNTTAEATIEADPTLPIIRITRDFVATPAQLLRAHTDPELFARWCGPDGSNVRIVDWDARTGGSWRFLNVHEGEEYGFHGSFHEVGPNRIVERPVFRGDAIVRAKLMNLSISCDHRVVDGWDAASFVQAIRRLLETPVMLFAD